MEGVSIALLLGILGAAGTWERLRSAAERSRIPLRIHVNGSRGKSTVTRLIASCLRETGIPTVARTTGTAARLILPDGSEEPIQRCAAPRILELHETIRLTARLGARALVAECMALRRESQWTLEHRILRSHLGVITNVREDHTDLMGPGLEGVARALSLTIPRRGILVTAERRFLPLLRKRAERLGTRVVLADASELPEEARRGIDPLEFAEDLALALKVCEQVGIESRTAWKALSRGRPDPGSLSLRRLKVGSRSLTLANAFAANDPDSSLLILQKLAAGGVLDRPAIALFNHRPDRLERSLSFLPFLTRELPRFNLGRLFLLGRGTAPLARALVRRGFPPERLQDLGRVRSPEGLREILLSLGEEELFVVGLGNIAGIGLGLVRLWEQEGESCHA